MSAKCGNCGVESSGRFCPECGHDKGSAASPAGIAPAGISQAVTPRPAAQMTPHTISAESTAPIGQLQGRFREIDAGTVTARGGRLMTDEGMVWEEKPSPIILLGLIAKYIIAVFLMVFLFGVTQRSVGGPMLLLLIMVVGVIHVAFKFWELTCTKYRMTSQRLEVTFGLFNQRTVTFELHQMAAGQITRPLFLRLVNRGNLFIPAPPIYLRAIRNPEVVRDMLRDFGQREASRMDKIRWR